MKAALLRGPRELELVEMDQPYPGPGQVVVRVRAGGICGSDVHAYRGSSAFQVYPAIPGHEVAGEVTRLGADVTGLSPGDHVVLDPMLRCGQCYPCRVGRYNCCTRLQVMGVHTDGGFRQYLTVDQGQLHRISPEVPFETAALIEPLCIGGQSVSRGRVSAEDSVLILGAGTIGLAALLLARQEGARVASVDLIPDKLEVARSLGADLTINAADEDVARAVLDWTGGEGPTVVIEAVGTVRTTRAALDYVGSAGRVVIVGITTQEVPLPVPLLVRKELDVIASRNSREQFRRIIRLVESGQVDPRPLISHRFPFERVGAAFALIEEQPQATRKVVLTMDSG
ncbi:MAG: zinc-binding alcohol dehydrogenase family protein [Anaerolineae bacterium]|nr:zinc-binding alcohol dehydrogenase family protein [Anaerolineae bacterium]